MELGRQPRPIQFRPVAQQSRLFLELLVAVRPENQDRGRAEPPGEMQQQSETRRPLEVIEQQHYGLLLGQISEQTSDPVEETATPVLRRQSWWRPETPQVLTPLREELRELGPVRTYCPDQLLPLAVVQAGAQGVYPGTVGRGTIAEVVALKEPATPLPGIAP